MSNRLVLTTSLDPYLDPRLRPGSSRCLALLRSLAGHARMFTTLTSSIATQLTRCVNTIRAYRAELVDAGYIWWVTDKRTGHTTVMIRTPVEPPSRRAAMVEEGGAQFSAPIKPSKNILPPFKGMDRPRAKESCSGSVVLRRSCEPLSGGDDAWGLRNRDRLLALLTAEMRKPAKEGQIRAVMP